MDVRRYGRRRRGADRRGNPIVLKHGERRELVGRCSLDTDIHGCNHLRELDVAAARGFDHGLAIDGLVLRVPVLRATARRPRDPITSAEIHRIRRANPDDQQHQRRDGREDAAMDSRVTHASSQKTYHSTTGRPTGNRAGTAHGATDSRRGRSSTHSLPPRAGTRTILPAADGSARDARSRAGVAATNPITASRSHPAAMGNASLRRLR